MKKLLVCLALCSSPAMAETCYQLSENGQAWSRTPETLCVEESGDKYELTLRTGLSFNQTTVATFNLDLLERVRCFDCNMDVFGVAIPSNSVFNLLKVSFDGVRDVQTGYETGEVTIGENLFYYRSAN